MTRKPVLLETGTIIGARYNRWLCSNGVVVVHVFDKRGKKHRRSVSWLNKQKKAGHVQTETEATCPTKP